MPGECNNVFPSLCFASENAFSDYFYSKKAITHNKITPSENI